MLSFDLAASPSSSKTPQPQPQPQFAGVSSFPLQGDYMPSITRNRESQERKREKSREKPRSKQQKRSKSGTTSVLASTIMSIGRALEERTRWGKRRKKRAQQTTNGTVDSEVLSGVFSKLGIETKIDQIEAEINAEVKAARVAASKKKLMAQPPPREQDLPSQFDEAYGNPAVHVQQHKFWTVAVCMLGAILAFQSVFLFRNHIARALPVARPALVSFCDTFGCTMPLPRDGSQVKITHSFNKRSERQYVLYANVTNNARYMQDWPSIELTLLNFIEQPLSRRIFTPSEWVPAATLAEGGIAPGKSVSTHLELEVTGVVPSRVDLQLRYP
jgi:hypothetical protein